MKNDENGGEASFTAEVKEEATDATSTATPSTPSTPPSSSTTTTETRTTASCPPPPLTSIVTIHENERCWIGKGFGKGGLLPNDRGRFSLPDGTGRWKTANEAFEDVLPAGWMYSSRNNSSNSNNNDGDDEVKTGEWWFARDFATGAVENASSSKGTFHWVRFRAIERPIVFDPNQFLEKDKNSRLQRNISSSTSNSGTIDFATTCDHCDSKEVRAVSKLLMEVLAYTSLLHAPNSLTDAMALQLKNKLVRILMTGYIKSNNADASNEDAFYHLQGLSAALHSFSEEERATLPIQSLFAHHFRERRQIAEFEDRRQMIAIKQYFSQAEREAIARILIRKLDPHFQLHCDKDHCGSDCQFEWIQCPNAHCTETLSKFYRETHEKQCPYTIISCESCNESFPRHKQLDHHKQVCPNRQAFCPFGSIGCIKMVTAKDIPAHLTNDVGSHLLLALNRLHEHESVMRNAHRNVQGLESKNADLQKLLAVQKGNADAEAKRLSNLERTVQQLQRKINNVESANRKQNQRIDDLEKQLRPKK